jgi:acetyl-CoA C-acetyltransferase
MPVIVGAGQVTDTTTPPDKARSPLGLMVDAVRLAAQDSGAGAAILRQVDSLAAIRLFSDSNPRFKSPFGSMVNSPWSIARHIGASPREMLYPSGGGNMPQVLVNRACERIARGECAVFLMTGAEALRTELAARRAGLTLDWSEDATSAPDEMGGHKYGYSEHEAEHGIRAAINVYPIIEQAIRGAKGRSVPVHLAALGKLFERFAKVAQANPLATRRKGYSAEEIITPARDNAMIGFPYTKLMNASAYVDMSAAVIVCSAAKADELGVSQAKRVYLHGCEQGNDHWYITERWNLHSSPAIRRIAQNTFAMAGKCLDDVALFDLYSCFTSAVQIGCQEIGIADDDPRDLTVTGGLPYFGGPGNNYVTHSIAEMVQRVRQKPGCFGLVTANGNYVTKHAAGLYSTTPLERPWERADPDALQRELDAMPKAPFTKAPNGAATIESYTVVHGKGGAELGIVIGRLAETGVRFAATTPGDAATLADLQARDSLNRPGTVRSEAGHNLFTPA